MSQESPPTVLRTGVEMIEPSHFVAYVFDMLGCFASGADADEAAASAPARVREYYQWLGSKDGGHPVIDGGIRIEVVERLDARPSESHPGFWLHGLFEEDHRPVRFWDIDMALRILEWNRQDLLAFVGSLPAGRLNEPVEGWVWKTPEGLLHHIAGSENWLIGHLGWGLDWNTLPPDSMERLAVVRERTMQAVPDWAEVEREVESDGERWTSRKVLRRLLWHERDHIRQLEAWAGRGPSGGS